jgi:predicted O-linked N-acetylglucosamine transferase (SPINDLY family)
MASADDWESLARAQTGRGEAQAALESLAEAVAAGPGKARTWKGIAELYAAHWKFVESDHALERATQLDRDDPGTQSLRAVVKQELGETAGAASVLEAARARFPDDLRIALGERLLLPQVYESVADVGRWRQRYAQGLASLTAEADRWRPRAAQVFDLERNNFLLAYQGEDDRELQRQYSAFLARLAEASAPEFTARMPRRHAGNRRLRVGFAGSIFRDCTAGRYFERWITGLDPSRFERMVYHTAPLSDAFTERISRSCERFVALNAGTRSAARTLLADELDVLIHPEVGMSSMTYVLAALRLAPVQCAGWGHPVTTGSEAIDCYFTCGDMEPPGAEDHYVERLVRLPGLGVDYAMPEPPAPLTRDKVRLPAEGRLYLCAQSLFKIHPEMDALFADIVAADATASLVFFQATARATTEQFAARLQKALASRGVAPRGQVKFLPRLAGPHFRGVLALADVVLDTGRWSGGNTSLDAFASGSAVVALPGRFMRGRQTAAMLSAMGLGELVASSPEDYVRIALDVARDRDRNARLRREIVQRRDVLFDQHDAVHAFENAILDITQGSGARR